MKAPGAPKSAAVPSIAKAAGVNTNPDDRAKLEAQLRADRQAIKAKVKAAREAARAAAKAARITAKAARKASAVVASATSTIVVAIPATPTPAQ
jgi:hypothetical protein